MTTVDIAVAGALAAAFILGTAAPFLIADHMRIKRAAQRGARLLVAGNRSLGRWQEIEAGLREEDGADA